MRGLTRQTAKAGRTATALTITDVVGFASLLSGVETVSVWVDCGNHAVTLTVDVTAAECLEEAMAHAAQQLRAARALGLPACNLTDEDVAFFCDMADGEDAPKQTPPKKTAAEHQHSQHEGAY